MIIETNLKQRYSLLKNIIREVNDRPWLASRKDIRQALRNPSKRVILYVGDSSTTTKLQEENVYGPTTLQSNPSRTFIRIGCKVFKDLNASKLRRWALKK